MASVPLNLANRTTHVVPDLGCTRSIGSRAAIERFQKHALYCGITTEHALAISPLCCQLWGRNLFGKLYYSFSDNTSVFYQTWSAWDERRAFLILPFSDEEFGYDYWTVPKRRQNYMSSFWLVLFSSRILHNGTTCVGLDESCVPAKMAWAICSPEETCNFLSFKPKFSKITHKNWTKREMIYLLFVQTVLPFLKTKMISLWCNLHQGMNRWQKSVNLPRNAEFLHRYEEEKDLQSGETHLPHWSKMCQETRASDQKKPRFWATIQTVKLSATS